MNVQGLLTNPLFMTGAGLLSNQSNPWQGALQGLAAVQGYKLAESRQAAEKKQAELDEMRLKQLRDAQARQQWTQAMLGAASSQNPGLLADPTQQAKMRAQAAAYGMPELMEAGGVLAPLPTSTELPAEARLYEWAKQDPARQAFLNRNNQAQAPANVQEWQYFSGLTPEQQQQYLLMKRSGQMFSVGPQPNYLPPGGQPVPLAGMDAVAANERAAAQAKAEGAAAGEQTAGAQASQPSIAEALAEVRAIKTDPAIDAAYGVVAGRAPTVRQATQDFEARRARLVDTLALAARGQLKGQGQISNFEQDMLRNAQTIIGNPLISPEAARAEMARVEQWLLAKQTAPGAIVPKSSPAQQPTPKPVIKWSDL